MNGSPTELREGSPAYVDSVSRKVCNWGRWGPDDERGTVNLTTPAAVLAAARCVQTGEVFELGIPLGADGPQTAWSPTDPRINPMHVMTATGHEDDGGHGPVRFADDMVILPLQSGTQWDALGHVHYAGQMYNGHSAQNVTVQGLRKNSIDRLGHVAGRGLLLDVARHRGVDWLQPGETITAEDLEEVASHQGVPVEEGDVLLIRTGWWEAFSTSSVTREHFLAGEPGLSASCASWLHERRVAALAVDNFGVDVVPPLDPSVSYPLHMLLIRDMGMTLGELFDLSNLSASCAADGRYAFLFIGPVLKVVGGVGSPVNPLAIK